MFRHISAMMHDADFDLMAKYYTLIPVAKIREQYPTVPWMGTLRGYVMRKENGDIYDGDWSVHRTKSVFQGKFMFHGYGIYLSAADEKYYVGSLEDSQCHGHGKSVWLSNSVAWVSNVDSSNSNLFDGLPFTYDGNFIYNARHGPALVTFKDGSSKHTIWSHDRLLSCSVSVYHNTLISPTTVQSTVSSPAPRTKRLKTQRTIDAPIVDTTIASNTRNAAKRRSETLSNSTAAASMIGGTSQTSATVSGGDVSQPNTLLPVLHVSATPIKDRLQHIKELHDEGLITDMIYEILVREYTREDAQQK